MTRLREWWRERNRWKSCAHSRLRGIYGDEIIFATPKFNRLQCLDCGNWLDGSVTLAAIRNEAEWDAL